LDETDEDRVKQVLAEPYESKEKPELEFDERELEREWLDIIERGEEDRAGIGNWSRIGVIHVGALTWSAIMAKSWSSSSSSSSNNCWARVFP
jgi:hypothetical protein